MTARYLLDTNIIIDHLRGYEPARAWLRACLEADPGTELCYCAVSVAELIPGLSPQQVPRAAQLLEDMTCLVIDRTVGLAAGEYVRDFRATHGVDTPDALIAAVAASSACALVTRNRRHFPMPDVKVVTPYS